MYMVKLITGMTTNEGIKHHSGSSHLESGFVPFGNSCARLNVVSAAFLRAESAIENHFCSSTGQESTYN